MDKNIKLIDRITYYLEDNWHASYVKHGINSLLNQRIMQIAADYEDANDWNTLRNDGVLKVCCQTENCLSTQPTMSRFENSISNKELHKISKAFTEFSNSTMKTIQLKILKITTIVKILKTKVKIEFPIEFPEIQVFKNLLLMFQWLRIQSRHYHLTFFHI